MDRINGADTIDIGGGRRGFRDENLVAGAAGTEVTALWLNMVQEEILKVIVEAGFVPSAGDWTQLWQALQALGLAPDRSRRWLGVNSMTLSSAPGAPSAGDAYLIPVGATGIWAGNVGKIAIWSGASWIYIAPTDGHGISLPDGRIFERIAGTYTEKVALDAQSGKWNYAIAGGTANALTASLSPAPPSPAPAGMSVVLKVATTNTGPATLNLNGLGAVNITTVTGALLAAGDLPAGIPVVLVFSGTAWILVGPSLSQVQSATAGNQQFFTASGTFVVPAGVTKLFVRVVGGGGGGARGGAAYGLSGGGGGAGGYAEKIIATTPGTSWAVTIGAGGSRGATVGGTGGTSSFGANISATGGFGGNGVSGNCAGGSGGTGIGGDFNLPGANGLDGNTQSATIQGGAGGGSAFGGGGPSVDGGGGDGKVPGAGGGGAWGQTQAFGANGAKGIVIVRW